MYFYLSIQVLLCKYPNIFIPNNDNNNKKIKTHNSPIFVIFSLYCIIKHIYIITLLFKYLSSHSLQNIDFKQAPHCRKRTISIYLSLFFYILLTDILMEEIQNRDRKWYHFINSWSNILSNSGIRTFAPLVDTPKELCLM